MAKGKGPACLEDEKVNCVKTEHMELDSRCSKESGNGQTGKERVKKERWRGGEKRGRLGKD